MASSRPPPDSPSRLTQFAPLSSEYKPSGGFFTRLFRKSTVEGSDGGPGEEYSRETSADRGQHQPQLSPAAEQELQDCPLDGEDETSSVASDSSVSSSGNQGNLINQPRTLTSVLKRLSNILDRRSQTPQAYKDSDFKQYWMPDSNCRQCYECGDKFNTFRRRHHCRICGQIFCSRCCNQEVPGKIMGYTGCLRVCTYCCKVVLSYAQNPDADGDLRFLSDDLKQHLTAVDGDIGTGSGSFPELWTPNSKRKSTKSNRVTSIFDEDSKQRFMSVSSSSPEMHSPSTSLNNPFDLTPQNEYSTLDSFQQERKILTQDSAQLRELWMLVQHPVDGIETQNHRHRLRTYTNCYVGSEIVDWLIARDKVSTRAQGVAIGQALMDARWLQCVTSNETVFRDEYALYRARQAAIRESQTILNVSQDASAMMDEDDAEPLWFKEIKREDEDSTSLSEFNKDSSGLSSFDKAEGKATSIFYVDHSNSDSSEFTRRPKKLKASSSSGSERGSQDLTPPFVHQESTASVLSEELFKGAFPVNTESVPINSDIPDGWQGMDHLKEENGERLAFERLSKAHREHMRTLTNQLLSKEGLSLKWAETVMSIISKISQVVRPDVRHEGDDMDIRQYVQIKKIPGEQRSMTSIICGVVCTKNVTHRKMRQHITNPRILLLRTPIEYQRIENKFSSLEPQILQEQEFLKKSVGRISALQPDIVLVEKSVSRVAQDYLLQAGITLVINVKPSVMQRVARFTQADIVNSIDGLVNQNAMGFCHTFTMQTYAMPDGVSKTLMYFDGCASHLGCTVTLRGGSLAELTKVKEIAHFMTYVAYHSKLETSFLMDEFAMPPPSPDENMLNISAIAETSPLNETNPNFQENPIGGTTKQEVEESMKKIEDHSNVNTEDEEQNVEKVEASDKESVATKAMFKRQKSQAIVDFSDPLQSYQKSKDESIFEAKTQVKLTEEKRRSSHVFKKATGDVILTCSPLLRCEIPYLESDAGQNCRLRKYFQKEIYWSSHFDINGKGKSRNKFSEEDEGRKKAKEKEKTVKLNPSHPFVLEKITVPVTDNKIQTMLADFRARGGRTRLPHIKDKDIEDKENLGSKVQDDNTSVSDWGRRVDCLDPFHHQRIAVLFGSFSCESANHPNPCVSPWVVSMEFYGWKDIPLGGFLERYCFHENYNCPSDVCDTPMVDHIRRFVHESGCLTIVLKKLEVPIRGHQSNNILMWEWCKKCKQVTPVTPMSLDTWSMSFAKYLELRFHGNLYTRRGSDNTCSHSLHHDHYQYFGYNQIVASFKYSGIILKEVVLPPIVIDIDEMQVPLSVLTESAKMLSFKGTGVYSTTLEHLHRLKRDAQTDAQASLITEYITQLQVNKDRFRERIDLVQSKLSEQSGPADQETLPPSQIMVTAPAVYEILDAVCDIKKDVAEAVSSWNTRISDFDSQQRKLEKSRAALGGGQRGIRDAAGTPDSMGSQTSIDSSSLSPKWYVRNEDVVDMETDVTFVVRGNVEKAREAAAMMETSQESCSSIQSHSPELSSVIDDISYPHMSAESDGTSDVEHRAAAAVAPSTAAPSTAAPSTAATSTAPSTAGSDDSQSEQDLTQDDPDSPSSQGQTSKGHQRSKSLGDPRKMGKPLSIPHDSSQPDLDKLEKKTVKTIFQSLLSTAEASAITMPFSAEEHYLLPRCDKLPMVVVDHEPSSIIAYTLSSAEYQRQLQELKLQLAKDCQASPMLKRNKKSEVVLGVTPDMMDRETTDDFSYFSSDQPDPSAAKSGKSNKQTTNMNIELQFSDNSARFYCRVYFADQFRKLRKIIFPAGEERYIRSLSSCFNWLARGGKSGSMFCKTQDDRFILKQMSLREVQSFGEFAPHYFQYITQACNEAKPTVLAKILGVYRIGYRNTHTNTALKQDLLVMENLFYGRKVTQIFDLKGSVRNRLVNTSGKRVEDLVLLDENLLKSSIDSPLYIRPHSKTVLTLAITNDTQFLSSNLVMDYSLLVGIDEQKKELVVGIIDYIRTFTWDKKLEMVFKTTYSQLGGQGKMPTVVSPEVYRSRFLEAMDRYFLLVPDRWTGLGTNVDC